MIIKRLYRLDVLQFSRFQCGVCPVCVGKLPLFNIMASIDVLIFDIDGFWYLMILYYVLVQIDLTIWHFEIFIGRYLTYSRYHLSEMVYFLKFFYTHEVLHLNSKGNPTFESDSGYLETVQRKLLLKDSSKSHQYLHSWRPMRPMLYSVFILIQVGLCETLRYK